MKRKANMRPAVIPLFLALVFAGPSSLHADSHMVLEKLGIDKGICVVCDDPRAEFAVHLAKSSDLLVYVHTVTEAQRQTACRAADAAGLYGTRVYVGYSKSGDIQLADNIADGIVTKGAPAGISRAEALRVMRPGAKALLGDETVTKPIPAGID
ncbi:MAG: hypothetical protein ACYS14_13930, partial [Planctomycetota bacterium]